MRPRTVIVVIIVIAVVIAGSFYAYKNESMIYGTLASLNLIPQPERFTELYFENASDLPQATVAAQPISFSFGIHNVEYKTTTYPYEVYFEDAEGNMTILAENTVTLPENGSTVITVSYVFKASNEPGRIVVDLTSLNQQIDFLLAGKS